MSYSPLAQAMINYVECHLENFDMTQMSETFGFSESYLRELFSKHVNMPIMQYYRKRRITVSAFEILHSGKKIVDIAFETGFSSHESYTRAFRKVFGMSPNRYRTDRPPIGRKQLDAGVFGLERLTEKEKRSDVFMGTEKQDSTILYGILKIEHGAYGSGTMFPICIKAVSEYLGDDVSYASIMAATGAAFRLVWNQADWDLSNIDIYHTLKESNDIYGYGAKALGRAFSFLGRDENTPKEAFTDFIKSNLAKGNPVIALGIIGPPEPCIVAGYDAEDDAVMGWNFFQNDLQFASVATTMDNGYFRCSAWWENTDTQAVMCMGGLTGTPWGDKEILEMAAAAMEAREECTYAKGLRAYRLRYSVLQASGSKRCHRMHRGRAEMGRSLPGRSGCQIRKSRKRPHPGCGTGMPCRCGTLPGSQQYCRGDDVPDRRLERHRGNAAEPCQPSCQGAVGRKN